MTPTPPLYFGVPVWGGEYVRVFLETALPSQLSAKNIPALPHLESCRYNIYTTKEDAMTIRASAVYARLSQLIPTEIHYIDAPICDRENPETFCNNHRCLSACHQDAITRAAAVDAANVLLNGDIVLADGFLTRTMEILASGKRVIELPGPRAAKAEMESALQKEYKSADATVITISPRHLARMWVDHMHPLESRHFWEGDKTELFHPSHIHWRVGEHSIFANCFHLVPMVYWPRHANTTFELTIDADLVSRNCPDINDTYVATNSDDIFCAELSGPNHDIGSLGRRGDVFELVGNLCAGFGTDRNFKLLAYPIQILGADESPACWAAARRSSRRLLRQVSYLRHLLRTAQFFSRLFMVPMLRRILRAAKQSLAGSFFGQFLKQFGPVRRAVLLLRVIVRG